MPTNLLLDRLPADERNRLLGRSFDMPWLHGQQLAAQDEASQLLIFPLQGSASLLTRLPDRPLLQVGVVGFEGVLGAQLALGVAPSPATVIVQQQGCARAVRTTDFNVLLPRSPMLRQLLLRYVQMQLRQLTTMAACLHAHPLRARLARWLLMEQERAQGDGFSVTQENMARLLGVRRVGVTTAAQSLHQEGLINYHRGWITVNNPAGLADAACSCHADDLASYRLAMNFSPRTDEGQPHTEDPRTPR